MASISSIIKKYQDIFSENLSLKFSNSRPTLGREGVGNKIFYASYLCQNRIMLLKFLEEARLIKTRMRCVKCKGKMRLLNKRSISDGFIWECTGRKEDKLACRVQKSIRHNSWFGCSRLNLEEILLLTYEIVKGQRSTKIAEDFFFSTNTLSEWRQFVNEIILNDLEVKSEKIGGAGKEVEVDESRFGKRKFDRGSTVESSQWAFGGMERGSGKFFIVSVHDRSPETLIGVIETWINKGTTIYSHSWKVCERLGKERCKHLRVEQSVNFINSGGDANDRWFLKSELLNYNRYKDLKFDLAMFLFRRACQEKKIDHFNTFLEIVRDIDWENARLQI